MGSSPKKQDYEPTDAERASASVAMAEYQYFKDRYDPLLQQMRDQSMQEDPSKVLRARANADTMHTLSAPSYQATQVPTASSDMSQAISGQLGIANKSGKDIQNQMRTNVLGIARGQAADAQTGMAQASRLATSEALNRARAKQEERSARTGALGQIAGSAIYKYADEKGKTGITNFFDAMRETQGGRI